MKLEQKVYYFCPFCNSPLATYKTRKGYISLCPANLCIKVFHFHLKHTLLNCTHPKRVSFDKHEFPFIRCHVCQYTVFIYKTKAQLQAIYYQTPEGKARVLGEAAQQIYRWFTKK